MRLPSCPVDPSALEKQYNSNFCSVVKLLLTFLKSKNNDKSMEVTDFFKYLQGFSILLSHLQTNAAASFYGL